MAAMRLGRDLQGAAVPAHGVVVADPAGLLDAQDVVDIHGRGLFLALELVADRASKRPFAPETMMWAKVKAEAMQRGLMIYPMGGIIDGVNGDHAMVMPPFIAAERDLDEIVARLGAAIDAAAA
jgi:hypothetical protein